ncbi:MAG: hypothetical protein M0Z38_08770 [Deltaproteobacteria bacterium]|nr:hypothetical protein [Deltaproteobacteria bacterium]
MSISPLSVLVSICLLLSCVAEVVDASPLSKEARENPHADIECLHCHKTVPERGKASWKEVAAGLSKDPVELCRECHLSTEVNHHPVQTRTARKLPGWLPLSGSGEVVCSTCHDVHLKLSGVTLLRGYDNGTYSVRMDMCLDCHGGDFAALNPHRVEAESVKCYTCHTAKPGAGDTGATIVLQERIEKICDFCHNVSEKEHPQNVNPLAVLPGKLPRGKDGAVNCGTCHDPHGTESTLHFLRETYVEFLEAGRYLNPHSAGDYSGCRGCHAGISTKKEDMRKNRKYGGDDLLICLSCHGSMDACHPILVKLGPDMRPGTGLPLSKDGKITCLTCHNPMPVSGKGLDLREWKPGDPRNAICFRCHDKADLSGRNPHSSMTDRESCRFCHDTMTDPTNEDSSRVSFISNTRLICLRCHSQDAHPMGVDHMVHPRMEIPEPFRLDGKGRITCTTCHNPHIQAKGTGEEAGRRKRFVVEDEGQVICTRCHRR